MKLILILILNCVVSISSDTDTDTDTDINTPGDLRARVAEHLQIFEESKSDVQSNMRLSLAGPEHLEPPTTVPRLPACWSTRHAVTTAVERAGAPRSRWCTSGDCLSRPDQTKLLPVGPARGNN